MAKQATSGSSEKDKRPSPSNGSKSPGKKSPKPVVSIFNMLFYEEHDTNLWLFTQPRGASGLITGWYESRYSRLLKYRVLIADCTLGP